MRECGTCTLCCRLLPVVELDKGADEKCIHQRFKKGCAVYNTGAMPMCCSMWNCRWLVNDDTGDLSRPDRARYVIDMMPEFITVTEDDTGQVTRINVVQIWVDDDTWRHDMRLRDYMMRRGAENLAILIRYDSRDALTIFPPSLTGLGQWMEKSGRAETQHTASEILFGGSA